MRAVRFELRTELARRWRTWLALARAAGLLGGLVAAALAAGRRTDSVVARYRSTDQSMLSLTNISGAEARSVIAEAAPSVMG